MDTTIADLRAKAAHLRKVADTIDGTIKLLLEFGGAEKPSGTIARSEVHPLRDLENLSGVDAIERVLSETAEPLSKDEIADRLAARGKAIGNATLQSYLSREEKFVNQGRGQWRLARNGERVEI